MSKRLLNWFTHGTEGTKSAGKVGLEIETDFLDTNGLPISEEISTKILQRGRQELTGGILQLELGRQKLELSINPSPSFSELWDRAQGMLSWLYRTAEEHGAYPYFSPDLECSLPLLCVQEWRDALWAGLDGLDALEELCRCSAVQFTVDVNPGDATDWINALRTSRFHLCDYATNDKRWSRYIRRSKAGYHMDRYGGPDEFKNLPGYCANLAIYPVVMHGGQITCLPVDEVRNLDVNLFLRSVWWHYRLRRYGDSLALEVRPISRRRDEEIPEKWELIKRLLNL